MSQGQVVVPVAELVAEVAAIFAGTGLSGAAAHRVAAALVEAEQQGLPSHGLLHVPLYVERLRKGSVSTREEASLVSDHGAVAVLDAGHMLGHLAAEQAMALAVAKAKRAGIGAVAVRHGFHFGAAGRYAAQAVEAGVIGIAMANTKPMMPAPGGVEAMVGNNPLAIGIPTRDAPAIVVDLAMSEGSLGRIRALQGRGEPIPANWAVTAEGRPTTDAAEAIRGLLLPIGGPKGFALSLAIDMLCGLLSGGAVGGEVRPLYGDTTQPNDCAFLMLALDPAAFGADDLPARAALARDRLRDGRPAPGASAIRSPGEAKWRLPSERREQVPVEAATLTKVRACAAPDATA